MLWRVDDGEILDMAGPIDEAIFVWLSLINDVVTSRLSSEVTESNCCSVVVDAVVVLLVERMNCAVGVFSSSTSRMDFCRRLAGGVMSTGVISLGAGTKFKCSIVSFGRSFSAIAKWWQEIRANFAKSIRLKKITKENEMHASS